MPERKTIENSASTKGFIDSIENERRRADSHLVAKMMRRVTGKRGKMWGPSIVGFGKHHYKLANGQQSEICQIGFSPRVQSLVFYLSNYKSRANDLAVLGKHRISGGGCIYINKLADVDLDVLERMFDESYKHGQTDA